MSTCKWLCQHVSRWQGWFTAPEQVPIPWTHLSSLLKRSKRHLENIPLIWSREQNGFSHLPLFLTMLLLYENIFMPYYHQVNWQTRSFKVTLFSLLAGWVFISYQSKSGTGTTISTHSSNPDIFSFCISSGLDRKSAGHAWPSFLWEYSSASEDFNQFQLQLFMLFERWVGPDYLLPFQVAVDMIVLGYSVELLRFTPFWVRPNSISKFPDYIQTHLGTYLFYPLFPLNEHVQQIIWLVQNPIISCFMPQ